MLRLGLLLLMAVVVLINLPCITGRYMPGHDSKQVLGIFDYMYSNLLFAGELPQWMAYGLHGLDAAPFHIAFLSASSYLSMYAGKLLGVNDSLALFSVSLCLEQLLFLLGFYLLAGRLFRERLTVFCICLTAVGLVEWQNQLFFNLRLFCLLPLAFYFVLRVRYDGTGYCGWLAGVVAILGPEGSTYAYVLWTLVLTVFSVVVFWGRFRSLKTLIRFCPGNTLAALLFVSLALSFVGTLWHALDNSTFASPGRDSHGNVNLVEFLTYGGNNLSHMLSSLLLPSAFMGDAVARSGMADYVGLIGLFCLPLALANLRQSPQALPFLITCVVIVALSLGGVLASAIYFLPAMHLFRHIGYTTGLIKVLLLIVAGFGCDTVIRRIRERTLILNAHVGKLALICLALLFYVDLNIGGVIWARACEAVSHGAADFCDRLLGTTAVFTLTRAALMLAFVVSAWWLCRSTTSPGTKDSHFTLALLVLCLIGDCILFQSELYSNLYTPLHPSVNRFRFPAQALSWPVPREEVLRAGTAGTVMAHSDGGGTTLVCELARSARAEANAALKYQTWTNAPGGEYQAALSSALQWDPPSPSLRVDWIARNVTEMETTLAKVSLHDLAIVSGAAGLKFRLLPETWAIHVKTDSEALRLLGSREGWDRHVILTDGAATNVTLATARTKVASRLDLGEFSANSFSLCLSNGLAQPAWLVHADAWAPGWQATVNGESVPVLRAYGAFKAVKVQPGVNRVRFYYHAGIRSVCFGIFTTAAALSAATGLLWMLGLIVSEYLGGETALAVPNTRNVGA